MKNDPRRTPRRKQKGAACALLALLCLGALTARPARAWNGTGHMTVADIAYDSLTPRTKAAVDALLQRHKDYARWMSQIPPGLTDRARFAFFKAATWPDDVRKTADDRPLWHFVDLPVVVPGYAADPAQIQPVAPNSTTQLPLEEALLSDKRASDADRAVALCWVTHLVGDLHQPLHDASLFSAQFPKGDRGGNSDLLTPGAVASDPIESRVRPRNLHALWDDLEGNTHDPAEVMRIAARLKTPAYGRKTYPQLTLHTTPNAWAHEENDLAWEVAYQNGRIALTPDGEKADVTLPPGYLTTAHRIADRLIALAGLRLADVLNGTSFPPVSAAPIMSVAPLLSPTPSPGGSSGPIIGNTRSHAYHVGDDGYLPAMRNRIYFQTEAEAQKAGYHKVGGQ